ncbi:MAG: serine hydrolase [Desulfobulbaceae bacterium]|nr:serine hydrolase [Desulfobulbaceae bacterium]
MEEGVYPGATAMVAYKDKKTWNKTVASCGYTQAGGKGFRVDENTFFDLASLTKPLCTALGFCYLAGATTLDLNTSVSALACCKNYPKHWQNIRLVNLLSHCSGLPAYRAYYQDFLPVLQAENKAKLLHLIQHEALAYQVRSQCLYSDLGYMVLGYILEVMSGLPLDTFFSCILADPCGLEADIGFLSAGSSLDANKPQIAATEQCPWRKRLLLGEVHDEHAWLMHGVAGHAGLFGRVGAVAELCMLLVDIWHKRADHPKLDGEVVRQALGYKTVAGLWTLGFDRPTPGQSSSGDYFSANSVGHLGYAGTSFWMDLEQEIVVVLLTNRVHPSRENKKIQLFRPYFHNRILREMI